MTLVVRTAASPTLLVAEVRRAVRAIDPTVPAYRIDLLAKVVDRSLASRRLAMQLLVIFAALAFLLTLIGVYGSVAEWTVRHRREIAIRLAIGARRDRVVGLVVRQGMALTGVGVAVGIALALGLRGMMQSLLFGVSSGDPVTFVATPCIVAAFALLAISVPAWRSARLDPNEVLRDE
jgi:ABC-type antimicrobial peptide transport system permease subunit